MNLIILAGGKGTRMKTNVPKWLTPIYFRRSIDYILDKGDLFTNISMVISAKDYSESISLQKVKIFPQKGSKYGSAVPLYVLSSNISEDEDYLIWPCDIPLVRKETLIELMNCYTSSKKTTVLTSLNEQNNNFGSMVLENGKYHIDDSKYLSHINVGLYIIKGQIIKRYLNDLKVENNEYSLTKLINIISLNEEINVFCDTYDFHLTNINSLVEVSSVNKAMQQEVNKELLNKGVLIDDIENTYISTDSYIEKKTIIHPHSYILSSKVAEGAEIGPMCMIKGHSEIGKNCIIGNFVELNRSKIGENTKVKHHAYLGDCEVGCQVNIGCGVITANYNGKNKQKTVINDYAFIGCNSNLIAPLTIEKRAVIAAGSTVRGNVEENTLYREEKKIIKIDDYKL